MRTIAQNLMYYSLGYLNQKLHNPTDIILHGHIVQKRVDMDFEICGYESVIGH